MYSYRDKQKNTYQLKCAEIGEPQNGNQKEAIGIKQVPICFSETRKGIEADRANLKELNKEVSSVTNMRKYSTLFGFACLCLSNIEILLFKHLTQ